MSFKRFLILGAVLGATAALQAADKATDKAKPYPLDFCLVSDEKFEGSDMTPYEMAVEGQTIKFCCKSCVRDFNKNTKKYLKKLDEESKKLAKTQPGS